MKAGDLRRVVILQNGPTLKKQLEIALGYPMPDRAVERGLKVVLDAVDLLPQKASASALATCINERVAYLLLVIPIEFPKSR